MKMLVMKDLSPKQKENGVVRKPSKKRIHRRAVVCNGNRFDSVSDLARHLGLTVQYVYRMAQSTAERHKHINFVVGKYG